jgi:hypothetical protein
MINKKNIKGWIGVLFIYDVFSYFPFEFVVSMLCGNALASLHECNIFACLVFGIYLPKQHSRPQAQRNLYYNVMIWK